MKAVKISLFQKLNCTARKSVSLGFTLMIKTSLRLLPMRRSQRICRKCTLMISMRSLISFWIMSISGARSRFNHTQCQIPKTMQRHAATLYPLLSFL
ncbi:Uncharacterised protein [Vibrio cholerae]|nr:Uncharacterised protein [Vibrio cholerae]